MPHTDGEKDLNTDREITEIRRHIGTTATIELLEHPSRDEVLKQILAHPIIHFACHGYSDIFHPEESALIVGKDTKEDLTIKDLQPISHQLAQLAYLSACSTAENPTSQFRAGDTMYARGLHLIDEGNRLADTFQIAGFRHVIGTIWEADDSAAVAIAGKFYEHLMRVGAGDSAVSRALHEAVMERRRTKSRSLD